LNNNNNNNNKFEWSLNNVVIACMDMSIIIMSSHTLRINEGTV